MGILRIFKRLAAFPDSKRLNERWWHRLANVGFVGLLLALPLTIFKMVVLDQRAQCFRHRVEMDLAGHTSTWDCKSGLIEFATAAPDWHKEWLLGLLIIFVLPLLVYSLAYRVALYVGMGDRWKAS
ncbi:hypothetical protein [Luteimonas sp. 3794]|uniref:hypothetical protein n=1 Tax=Luteimonas sp. 3794 TaxID=2817730 RepID=UPI0028649CC3|nr:hypothetical protein [Luteimonas sp. 3794]MDR6992456.1 hypothetical protein [Luteimonas sp. 3794]